MNTMLLPFLLGLVNTSLLEAEPPFIDKGDVRSGVLLVHSFKLHNRGKGVLTVTDLSGSCGCLNPRLSKQTILPGEFVFVRFEVNTLTQKAGENTWRARVKYRVDLADEASDAPTGEIEVAIKANIIREVLVEPVTVFLSGERELSHTIQIKDSRPKPLTITRARSDLKHLQIAIAAPSSPTPGLQMQTIRVAVAETCPVGHYSEIISLFTNDPLYPELRVPIHISKRSANALRATPEQLTLRLASGQTTASGLVRLRDPEDQSVVVEKIEADHPAIQTRWAKGPGSMLTVRISIDASKHPGNGQGTVTMRLREPKPQVLTIPVTWIAP